MQYDLIVIGGGIAGASLGLVAARAGFDVLVVEAEQEFRDRVRGEGLHSWGVREARRLEIADLLYATCARSLPLWDTYLHGARVERRDLPLSTRCASESMAFYHPEMQTVLIMAAERAGARVMRGARVLAVEHGRDPRVELVRDGGAAALESARLVAVAAGRGIHFRSRLGLRSERAARGLRVSGLLFENVHIADDAVSLFFAPAVRGAAPVFPLPHDRARIYVVSNPDVAATSYAGDADAAPFLERCHELGVPREWLRDARPNGPLATFDGTPSFAAGTWPSGVALLGDAAGSLDPAFGAGLSLALRDVRTLADELRKGDDLQAAACRYERERARYYRDLLRLETWAGRILYGLGAPGDAPMVSLLPRMRELGLDIVGGGPDCPLDDAMEQRLFGESSVALASPSGDSKDAMETAANAEC